MDQQNIDRLFREKLDTLEVTPSAEAWSQVEKSIRPRKNTTFYWVAASVTLLIASWLVWPAQEITSANSILSDVNHPMMEQQPPLEIPVAVDLPEKKSPAPVRRDVTPKATQPTVQFASIDAKDAAQESNNDITLPELETINTVAMAEIEEPSAEDMKLPEQVEEEKPDYRTVKITYIASASTPEKVDIQKADSTNVLKKFIALAEKIDPGDVLADIRTAKDNFISSGFKNKKDKNSMNP